MEIKFDTKSVTDTADPNATTPGHSPSHDILSRREKEILLGIAIGKTVTEIARGSALSVKTVSTYRTRLLKKMGFQSNQDIIQYAHKSKLVP